MRIGIEIARVDGMSKTQSTEPVTLPARLAWLDGRTVIAGTRGAHGDAGWTLFACDDEEHRARVAAQYPQARMPCWARFGL